MAEITENKTVRVRYINESSTIEECRRFGWVLVNKTLLNRFGNPLPIDHRLSEAELKEKCYLDLYFRRTVDENLSLRLSMLQMEYDKNVPVRSSFGGGRVTGLVFLSLAFIIFFALIVTYFFRSNGTIAQLIAFITINQLAAGGMAAIIITGVLSVKRGNRRNIEIKQNRLRISEEASKLLANK